MSATPVEPASEGPPNPKAEAKAAKAYAKAMRPWYKKKRVIIPAAFVALGVAVSAGSSSNSGTDSASSGSAVTSSSGSKAEQKKDADKQGVVGTPVTNSGTTYEVTSVDTKQTLGASEYSEGTKADGTFVIASLAITNNKDETKTFMDNTAKLVTADGDQYEASTDAAFELKDDLMMEDIQPDLTKRGSIAFDVPSSKVAGSKLVIEDFWGRGHVEVDLGI
jgi:hypothetical protein